MFFIHVVGGDPLSQHPALPSVGRTTTLSGILLSRSPGKQTTPPDVVSLLTTQVASRGEGKLDGSAVATASQVRLAAGN